nr:Dna2/Cas4 domain-containing protein [Caldivirga sp. UBA161]
MNAKPKNRVKRIIQDLRKYIQNQELPPRTVNKAKCRACYYKNICSLRLSTKIYIHYTKLKR